MTEVCVIEDKTAVVVAASYRSFSRNPVRFKALFHTQVYRNSKEQYHAGLLKTKFGAKYLKTCATKYAPQQARKTTFRLFVTDRSLHEFSFNIHSFIYSFI